jgi:uncharacterized Rmd1/YagE family protein
MINQRINSLETRLDLISEKLEVLLQYLADTEEEKDNTPITIN